MADQNASSFPARRLPRLRFGLFELDRTAGTLLRKDCPVRLPPQPLAMLIELVEHAGEEVTREHLKKTVWPADTFVDFDASIGSCIRKIRLALGDTSENPVFIRTLHRKGFQFIAPVHVVMPAQTSGTSPGIGETEGSAARSVTDADANHEAGLPECAEPEIAH